MNLFEIATRKQFRFPYNGSIDVEAVWTLPVEEIDGIFRTLNGQVKQENEESLLRTEPQDIVLLQKIEILRYIVAVKQEEKELALRAKERKEKEQRILEILKRKKDESLEAMSEEDLEKMLRDL